MVIWSAFDANNYSMSIATAFEFFEQCFGFMRSYIKAKIVVFSWDKVNIIYIHFCFLPVDVCIFHLLPVLRKLIRKQ